MSGLSPVDVRDDKMLPAVYRRSDIVRQGNAAARRPAQGRPEGLVGEAPEATTGSGYARRARSSSATTGTVSSRKGLLVDVWV